MAQRRPARCHAEDDGLTLNKELNKRPPPKGFKAARRTRGLPIVCGADRGADGEHVECVTFAEFHVHIGNRFSYEEGLFSP